MSKLYFAILDYGAPAISFMWSVPVVVKFILTKYRLTKTFPNIQ